MSFWTAAVVIVAIWAFVTIYSHRHDGTLGVTRDEDGNPVFPPRDESELQREVKELRERVKVLERIATDDREAKRLSSEIDRLRDE
ncbi:hypothetical protein [Alteraurantiacibacter aquimixticola]|uniref:Uncharacterized protein n=1 Tax=Alteraurantiacibacter aquimixticola TaxID=2489173 RepID=A0A4V4U8U9_9SPHN|nr:hypothetical protein [Alteraurantiacibacter aquimixticola]TIX51447.1 hypothetical protein E5222_03030 [Alteraurantiacibacter aquimixticola]